MIYRKMNPTSIKPECYIPELLAPAGGLEAGYAAFHYGADGIYLGLPRFSARAEASNFTLNDLQNIIAIARSFNPIRRVYVTLNTLVLQREIDELIDVLADVVALGVDAVILQDWGVCGIVRRYFPELRIHASTQMAIHNRPGVELARELGFSRVTLARELTMDELTGITALPGVETEVFIHGALCYSYSGLCLFSSHVMGRSGNRGRCAYLCRDQYQVGRERRFAFSMKDLALPQWLQQLGRLGVTALKIEGRMKSPIYVAASVNYYRKLLNGAVTPAQATKLSGDIQTIFSRPWTDLYLRSRHNRQVVEPEHAGHRGRLLGRVAGVLVERSGEDRLRFTPGLPIEVHDGLQIDVPGLLRPFGFAVAGLRMLAHGRPVRVFEAPAGAMVEVVLPGDHPHIPVGASIHYSSSQALKRRYRIEKPNPGRLLRGRPVDFEIHVDSKAIRVEARCPAADVIHAEAAFSGFFLIARDGVKMTAAIEQAFAKLGGTRFESGKITINNPDSLFIPVSLLNRARRELIDQLEAKWQAFWRERMAVIRDALNTRVLPGGGDTSKDAGPRGAQFLWSLKIDSPAYIEGFDDEDWRDMDEVVIEMPDVAGASFFAALDRFGAMVGKDRVRIALPAILRDWEMDAARKNISALVDAGWFCWQAANSGAWKMLRSSWHESVDISVDWPLYAMNQAAGRQMLDFGASSFTLSPEDDLENLRSMLANFGDRAVVIVYQDTPLMISEACVMPEAGCDRRGGCGVNEIELQSSFDERVRVIRRGCRMIVMNEKPFCLGGRLDALADSGVIRLRVDFICRAYPAEQAREIWRGLRMNKAVPGTHIGNFERGLQ